MTKFRMRYNNPLGITKKGKGSSKGKRKGLDEFIERTDLTKYGVDITLPISPTRLNISKEARDGFKLLAKQTGGKEMTMSAIVDVMGQICRNQRSPARALYEMVCGLSPYERNEQGFLAEIEIWEENNRKYARGTGLHYARVVPREMAREAFRSVTDPAQLDPSEELGMYDAFLNQYLEEYKAGAPSIQQWEEIYQLALTAEASMQRGDKEMFGKIIPQILTRIKDGFKQSNARNAIIRMLETRIRMAGEVKKVRIHGQAYADQKKVYDLIVENLSIMSEVMLEVLVQALGDIQLEEQLTPAAAHEMGMKMLQKRMTEATDRLKLDSIPA